MPDRPAISYEPRVRKRSLGERLAIEWSHWASRFTRENIISNLKTLAWVIPLTFLIWIYAEREQIATTKDEPVPFELVENSADRAVMLTFPADKNLMLELQGPQARLQDVLAKLRGGSMPQGLRIELPSNLEINQPTTLQSLPLVRQQRIFADNGITVLACQPPQFRVQIDQIVEREAQIVVPPEVKNVSAHFEPPTVRIRGPLSDLTRAERASPNGTLAVLADLHEVQNKPPGQYPVMDVTLRRSQDLDLDRVSIMSHPRVRASVDVKQADKTYKIPSIPITVNGADTVMNKYQVSWDRPSLPILSNVTVSGPPTIIDSLDRPDFTPKPQARLDITAQDAIGSEPRSKVVKYDMPDGVKVAPEDQKRTVEFHLVERSSLPPGQ
jgi:hypothetical protein